MPGLITGDDFTPPPAHALEILRSYFPWPSVWDPSYINGFNDSLWLASFPLWSFAGLLGQLHVPWTMVERIVWLYPLFILLCVAPYVVALRCTRSPLAAAVGASLFALNTWTIGLIERGHIPSLVAYALMPLVLLKAWQFLRAPAVWSGFAAIALWCLQIVYDLRYALISILCAIVAYAAWYCSDRVRFSRAPKPALNVIAPVLAFAVAANLYWLGYLALTPFAVPSTIGAASSISTTSSYESFLAALCLYYPYFHYVPGTDGFHASAVDPWFFAVPFVVAYCAYISRKVRPLLPVLLTIAVIGVLLTAGPAGPAGPLITYAFTHVPGFSLFRDTGKFTSLVATVYSLIISLGVSIALRKWRITRKRFPAALIVVLLAAIFVPTMAGAYEPLRYSNFSATSLTDEDKKLAKFIALDPTYGKTLFVPSRPGYWPDSGLHPTLSAGDLENIFPYLGDTTSIKTFLASPLTAIFVKQIGVKEVVLTDDSTGFMYRPFGYNVQHAEMKQFLDAQPWLSPAPAIGRYALYHVHNALASNGYFVRTPLFFSGALDDLETLARAGVVNDASAVIVANSPAATYNEQQLSNIFRLTPDVVIGEWPTTDRLLESSRFREYLGHVRALEDSRRSGGLAFVFAPSAMRRSLLSGSDIDFFKNSFDAPVSGQAAIEMFTQPRPTSENAAYIWNASARLMGEPERSEHLYVFPHDQVTRNDFPFETTKVTRYGRGGHEARIVFAGNNILDRGDRGQVELATGLAIPADLNPIITMRVIDPDPPYVDNAVILYRSRESRRLVDVRVPLDSSSTLKSISCLGVLQAAFDRMWQSKMTSAGNDDALKKHLLVVGPREASEYDLVGLRLEVTRNAGSFATLPASMIIQSLRISVAGDSKVYSVAAIENIPDLKSPSAVVSGHGLMIRDVHRSSHFLAVVANLSASPNQTTTGTVQVGDSVSLALTDYSNISGVVVNENRDEIMLRASDGETRMVSRFGIAEVSKVRRPVRQSIRIEVPLQIGSASERLRFNLSSSPLLVCKAELLTPSGAHPVDLSFKEGVNSESSRAPDNESVQQKSPTLPLEEALDARTNNINPGTMLSYDVDIAKVVQPGASPSAISPAKLLIEAAPAPDVDLPALMPAEVDLANVVVFHGIPAQGSREPDDLGLIVDGKPIALKASRRRLEPRTADYIGAITLRSGSHIIQTSLNMQERVDAATVTLRALKKTRRVRPVSFAQLNRSEFESQIQAHHAGVVVFTQMYAPGWSLAVLPSDSKLSGNLFYDYWRLRRFTVSSTYHIPINGLMNGWIISPSARRIVVYYFPTVVSYIAALCSLAMLFLVTIVGVAIGRRHRATRDV